MAPMSLGSLPPSERAFATLAVGAYLRRTAWPRRRLLMGGCALAVLFDAAQWWARQGPPGRLWRPSLRPWQLWPPWC